MALNRNSNVYTVIYATVLTVLVAVLLTVAAVGLAPQQKANSDNEKKQQILSSISSVLGKDVTLDNAAQIWDELNMDQNLLAVNVEGNQLEGVNVFELVAKQQFSKGEVKADAQLPVFCANVGGTTYYIMCMYGAGLWDAIWGYIAVDAEGQVYGCSFDHAGETAGLGAKIKDDPNFAAAFCGKNVWKDGELASIDVNKPGKANRFVAGGEHVDCITGATKTSDCVSVMMFNSLSGYKNFLLSIKPMALSTECCGEAAAPCCGEGEGYCKGESCENVEPENK
ncbi:MAG: FMN-binding protein [Bacteroidales bacterium]|nr:FMN-binding protein [Candidatus Liminaster caballi]